MNISKLTVFICLLAVALGGAMTSARAQSQTIFRAPDPAIMEYQGRFYLFATDRGISTFSSDDLVHWQSHGPALEPMPEWSMTTIPGGRPGWAPDIFKAEGKFYLTYSVSTVGSQRSAIGLAENTTLDPNDEDYQWKDRGIVLESDPEKDNFNAIDSAVFSDQKGNWYMIWGSHWDGIKGTKLNLETGRPVEDFEMVSVARAPDPAIEAPFVIYHDGYYYLFVSFGTTLVGQHDTYRVKVGRSTEPLGPYRDMHGNDMADGAATLVLAGHDRWVGPGHNAALQTEKGDFLVHHARYLDHMEHSRALQIRPMYWSQDGWPMVTEPLTTPFQEYDFDADMSEKSLAGTWKVWFDYDFERRFELLAGGCFAYTPDARWEKPRGNRFSLRLVERDGMQLNLAGHGPDYAQVADFECVLEPCGQYFVGRSEQGNLIRGKKITDNR